VDALAELPVSTLSVVSSAWSHPEASSAFFMCSTMGRSRAAAWRTQSQRVVSSSSRPARENIRCWRVSGRWSTYFPTSTVASRPLATLARGRAKPGDGEVTTPADGQDGHTKRSRTACLTTACPGTQSIRSELSSPIFFSSPPQRPQVHEPSSGQTRRSRGRLAGQGLRPWGRARRGASSAAGSGAGGGSSTTSAPGPNSSTWLGSNRSAFRPYRRRSASAKRASSRSRSRRSARARSFHSAAAASRDSMRRSCAATVSRSASNSSRVIGGVSLTQKV